MTAVEEIQAAIEKLSRLRSDEPWRLVGGNEWITPIGIGVAPDDGGISIGDAELIVTLHRTIDAQIDVLGAARFNIKASPGGYTHATVAAALCLARAINGSAS